eukprot:scaffold196_cov371-Prasinococcus_capsulatus_cf.AAC.11
MTMHVLGKVVMMLLPWDAVSAYSSEIPAPVPSMQHLELEQLWCGFNLPDGTIAYAPVVSTVWPSSRKDARGEGDATGTFSDIM